MEPVVLAFVAALAVLPTAAWLHPGRSRGLAVASVLLAFFPFVRGVTGAMSAADAFAPFTETWKVWVARVLVAAILAGVAFAFATVRVESWWPAFVALAVAGLLVPDALAMTGGAIVAGTALGPILRGGFGDPMRWRRIGAFVCLLALALANGVLLREALIQ